MESVIHERTRRMAINETPFLATLIIHPRLLYGQKKGEADRKLHFLFKDATLLPRDMFPKKETSQNRRPIFVLNILFDACCRAINAQLNLSVSSPHP